MWPRAEDEGHKGQHTQKCEHSKWYDFLNLGLISIAPPHNPQPSQTRLGELKVKARAENTNSSKSSNQNEVYVTTAQQQQHHGLQVRATAPPQ